MINIIQNNNQIPFLTYLVKDHQNIKPIILDSIKEMGNYCIANKIQSIFNTDWHLGSDFERNYFKIVSPIFIDLIKHLNKLFKYEKNMELQNYWFQQYKKNDFHTLHNHRGALLNCIYYVDMPNKAAKTTFELFDKEFEIDVKEGEILIFPAFLNHCSKPNKSEKLKTIIAFNLL
jgi:hypothetical protein